MSALTKSPYQIIVRPIVTEKSVAGGADNQYTFVVARTANKYEIAEAIERIQADSKNIINVVSVNTMVVKGKTLQFRRFGRANKGRTSDWKKAIVTLKPGQSIELVEGV
ncbi:MAG: 50S ribosomal protein L23 [Janthinobacterium lividum]